jgi:predicted AAA+ superfamily ATPase
VLFGGDMYVIRENEEDFFESFEGAFVSALLGPRRVGKTTLVEHFVATHPERKWIKFNMDERKQRQRIANGELELMIEESSLQKIGGNEKLWVVIDEAQKCPELFDQVKILYDAYKGKDKIKFILTGSAYLNLHQLAAETLAGRVDLLRLREFNLREMARLFNKDIQISSKKAFQTIFNSDKIESLHALYSSLRPFQKVLTEALAQQIIWGGLPEVLEIESDQGRLKYLSNYLQTYLEKDIREITTISDLLLYENLMRVMAEQTGSVRDDQKVVNALQCSRNTLQKYEGYLAATWQYFEVEPYIGNTLKRLVKSPKGYLRNNGLISYFTGIRDSNILNQTGLIGHRFENWFLNELSSFMDPISDYHKVYFWRTHSGQEVDFIVQMGQKIFPFEITYSTQVITKKIRNLRDFLADEPKAVFGIYLYQGQLKYDEENKILFLPAWMI